MRIRLCLPRMAIFVVGVGLLLNCGCSKDVKRIQSGGSTFVDPIMQKWSAVYRESKGIEIDYKKSGSGNGIQQMTAKTLDFGCTDAPMNREQTETAQQEGGEVVHIPVTMGAVVMIYNLPGVEEQLILDGNTIAQIYRGQAGKVTTWDNEEIAKLNPKLKGKLPKLPIVPVYRAEASGTTNIFTEFLSKSNQKFADEIGVSQSPKWPKVGTGQNGNDGISGFVKNPENVGSIGYVEIYYAQKNGIKFARIMNRKGMAISADDEGVVAASAEAAMVKPAEKEPYTLHELTFSLTDTDSDKAYPICGISYAVLYKKQPENKGKKIVEFLKWAASDGQKYSKDLGYAPLPEVLIKKILTRLDQVQYE